MTTSMPIQAPAEAMCATRKILRVRAPNRHGRIPPPPTPRAKGGMTLPYLDAGPPWKPSRIEFRTITLIVAAGTKSDVSGIRICATFRAAVAKEVLWVKRTMSHIMKDRPFEVASGT